MTPEARTTELVRLEPELTADISNKTTITALKQQNAGRKKKKIVYFFCLLVLLFASVVFF